MSTMASSCCCFAAFLLAAIGACVNAQSDVPSRAMFVFGDSYADTGNSELTADSWHYPYGKTWPQHPTGRFSDGRLLTDYIASNLSIDTPLPHANWSTTLNMSCDGFSSGVNFAHGGTGVFTTYFATEGPTLSCQIDQFERISNECPNIESLIDSSLVLLVMVGNDYITYLVKHQHEHPINLWELLTFMFTVVHGIEDSINRLYNIGFRKFAVANLEPAGCISRFVSPDNQCNDDLNNASNAHNTFLSARVASIGNNHPDIQLVTLDHFKSFRSVQENQFGNNLQPCINSSTKAPCSDPDEFFFWDLVHPTQAAWKAVTSMYMEDICKLAGSCNEEAVGFE